MGTDYHDEGDDVSGCIDVIKGRLEDSESTYHRRVRRLTDARQSEEHAVSELTNIAELLDELDVKDNRIAELEAKRDALRCCANCETREEEHDYEDWWYFCPIIKVSDDPRQNRLYDQKVNPDDPCQFAPSCWTKREGGGG